VIPRQFPLLTPCAHPGCRRLSHWRYCPEHADEDQRELQAQLDEVRLKRDLARSCIEEMDRLAEDLERRLGIERPPPDAP